MKKTIIALVLALSTLTLWSKEISTSGNLTLTFNETTEVYSIKGNLGIITLGDLKEATETLLIMDKSFTEKKLSIGTPDFKVMEDDEGMYIIKIGLGGVKIRPADAAKFSAVLCGKRMGKGISKGIEKLKNEIKFE